MGQPVTLPLWLLVLILGFAAVAFASHFVLPSMRWFFRARVERAVALLNTRLDRPIDLFKVAERQDRIARLIYDASVMEAVVDYAAETGQPVPVVFQQARVYAREIVPGFSATLYFGVAIRAARWLSRLLYRVRFGKPDDALRGIDPRASLVFVINHRSNMDYVLVTWLVAGRASLSYAVGEWARIWPLSGMIRAMGAYFIRRNSSNALYRRVLARYVQMTTGEGITQAIFPEGRLSVSGRTSEAKLGLLSYIMAGAYARDVVFVPVGLAYDRVLEDRVLIGAAAEGSRRFRMRPWAVLRGALGVVGRLMVGRFRGFGTAAASFGAPVSLRAFQEAHPGAATEVLGRHLMAAIEAVVPVVPVPLVAAALRKRPADFAQLLAEVQVLQAALVQRGAVLKLAPQGDAATVQEGLDGLQSRRLIGSDYRPLPGAKPLLDFYAASILQRLDA